MIVCGYQGVGKSSLSKNGSGYIDLESGNFWIDGNRHKDWYIPYCNIAVHLSQQGYCVFLSSHKCVREYLSSIACTEDLFLVYPAELLKGKWIDKLEKRYLITNSDKDYKAWKNAERSYSENILDLTNQSGFNKIQINSMQYDLHELIKLARSRVYGY